jgi:ubiquinone/menaquinone biosynthesis C-methylase UbiE
LLYQIMTSTFDLTASTFERHRSLPKEVPEAIRAAIWSAAGLSGLARVLDIGAGTGRIGRAFVTAGDTYFGVDTSLAMLQEFSASSANCTLTQADGSYLPFSDGDFDVVLLMQVLTGASDWKGIVSEARRVVRSGGCVVVGYTINPESGIDAQLKRHLKGLLEEMHVDSFRPEQSKRRAQEWLEGAAVRHVHSVVASWAATVTPEAFLDRHSTGARFAALPADVQEQALDKLCAWAKVTYGSLDIEFAETRSFEIDIYQF